MDRKYVLAIEAEVFQLAFDFAGGGLYGVDKVIRTKKQADHSLPYLLAVALLDGNVMPAQFKPERVIMPDVQALLKKVSVRPNHEFTELYPQKMPAKIIVRLQDGKMIEHWFRTTQVSLLIRSHGETRCRNPGQGSDETAGLREDSPRDGVIDSSLRNCRRPTTK